MLATIERIETVRPHPNADRLDIVEVGGYECIVGRDNHEPGEAVLLIQPDVILPADQPWCAELLKYTSKGRVKAARLRGEWSMGIVVALRDLPDGTWETIGQDLGEQLGIVKHEPPLPKDIKAKGGLPFGIPKTDEERWQKLRCHMRRYAVRLDPSVADDPALIADALRFGEVADITLKIDGASFAAFCVLPGHAPIDRHGTGICSRSLELKTDAEMSNPWLDVARETDVCTKLAAYCAEHDVSLALRGEVYGVGIQTLAINPHCRLPRGVAFFSVWNIATGQYEGINSPHYYRRVCEALGLPMVPLIAERVILSQELIDSFDHGLEKIDGVPFEGVVVKGADFSFKIMNKYYDSHK